MKQQVIIIIMYFIFFVKYRDKDVFVHNEKPLVVPGVFLGTEGGGLCDGFLQSIGSVHQPIAVKSKDFIQLSQHLPNLVCEQQGYLR